MIMVCMGGCNDKKEKKAFDYLSLSNIEACEVGEQYATIRCNVSNPRNAQYAICGFKWGTSPTDLSSHDKIVLGDNEFMSANIFLLEPNSTYYFQPYVQGLEHTTYGEIKRFTTKKRNVIQNLEAEVISPTKAIMRAKLIRNDKDGLLPQHTSTEIYNITFCYSTEKDGDYFGILSHYDPNNDIQTLEMDHLSPNTTYYYRTHIIDNSGYKDSGDNTIITFTTPPVD